MRAALDHPPDEPADAPAPPRMRIVRRLGEGGMGRVWLAERTLTDDVVQRVVIKRPLAQSAGDEALLRRFANETHALARFSHGNVVHLLDAGCDAHGPWMALEFVEGLDAHALLESVRANGERVDVDEVAWIAHEAARGMAAAHAVRDAHGEPAPVLHRDLSPQNIFLSRAGEVKVGDFGIAWAVDRGARTTTGVVVGNLRYIAPEQLEGRALGPATDIYGIGRVIEELLECTLEAPSLLALREVAARATRRAPDERHPSMDALADALVDAVPTLLRGRSVLAKRVVTLVLSRDRIHGALAGLLALERASVPALAPPSPRVSSPRPDTAAAAVATSPRRRVQPIVALAILAGTGLSAWIGLHARTRTERPHVVASLASLPRELHDVPRNLDPARVLFSDASVASVPPTRVSPIVRDEPHRVVPRHESPGAPAADAAINSAPARLLVSTLPYSLVAVDNGALVGAPHAFELSAGEHHLRASFSIDGGVVIVTRVVTLRPGETLPLGLTPP